jgi:L-lysine 2,3-aminomutase
MDSMQQQIEYVLYVALHASHAQEIQPLAHLALVDTLTIQFQELVLKQVNAHMVHIEMLMGNAKDIVRQVIFMLEVVYISAHLDFLLINTLDVFNQ